MNTTEVLTDEILAERLRTDTQFLGEIIERYETKLTLFIRRKSSASIDDAKDILQNVFIKVYKNINDFDTTLTFSSWIYRITRNEMIDWYRKEKRKPHVSLEGSEMMLETIASESNVAESVAKAHSAEDIKALIETLPDKYREIVLLRYFEDKSYDEIADILTLPPGTVAVRLNRVKTLLRDTLRHYENRE